MYFADAKAALEDKGFDGVTYVDDLNAFKEFDNDVPNSVVRIEDQRCKQELHAWGEANWIVFDASKESSHILSRTDPEGDDFRILGVLFDCQLLMHAAVRETICEASWRTKTLLRTHRYFSTKELVNLFKAHISSFIEYR